MSNLVINTALEILREYENENKLPPQKDLVSQYFVSRSTIVKALKYLQEEGYIYSIKGSGVFFSKNRYPMYLEGIYSYDYQLKKNNITVYNELVSLKKVVAKTEVCRAMNLNKGDVVYELIRKKLNLETKELLIVQINYLSAKRFENLDQYDLNETRLYVTLYQHFNLNLTEAYEEIAFKQPTKKIAAILGVYEDKFVEITRTSYEDSLVVEYTKSYLDPNKFKYAINLNLNNPVI